MKKFYLQVIFLIICSTSIAQANFDKGYFIDNNGNKTTCLIKNMGWKETPTKFQYKLSENDDPKFATIKTVKEFGISKVFIYKRVTVLIDQYVEPGDKKQLDYTPQPNYKEKTIFLKVLIDGRASLYSYSGPGYQKFFYSFKNIIPKQLFYKRYLLNNTTISENNQYKQQLFNNFKCETLSSKDALELSYSRKDLIKYFKKFNGCKGFEYLVFYQEQSKSKFNLTVRPGINFNSLSVTNRINSAFNVDFESQSTFRIGIEAELIFGFNQNKWSLIFEPTYQYFKSNKVIPFRSTEIESQSVNVDYKSIELPLGVRHYFNISDNSKIFINASLVYNIDIPSKIDYELAPSFDLELTSNVNFAIGFGYKYGKNLSLELRHYTNQDFVKVYRDFSSNYQKTSIILGYTLF